MPDLTHLLHEKDLGFLQILAELWGLDLNAPDARSALPELVSMMKDSTLVMEIVESLPGQTRKALDELILRSGWMTWSHFVGEYGELREVGPGKRDREKPYLDPISPTEMLWYRGLIGRDFLKREGELKECTYIPDDLLELLPKVEPAEPQPPGRAASPGETGHIIKASDRILDHACTLLAALRLEDINRSPAAGAWKPPLKVIHALLAAMKLITSSEQPVPEDARPFLEMPRGEALAWLVQGWRESALFNELKIMPGLICEGAWHNQPKAARQKILNFLSEVPEGTWWNLKAFIAAVHEREPDFQRPAGDFDTWLIRDVESGDSLKGLSHWAEVDGALIRYLIAGPMHWLGLMDLAAPRQGVEATAFRFSGWADQLLMGKAVELPEENQLVEAFSEGTITAGRLTPRLGRYQISRFCLWVDETEEQYTYQITPASLEKAREQGLKVSHLERLLNRYSKAPPPVLLESLNRWAQKGGEVRIFPCIVLRVATPKILQALRESPGGRFLGEPLGPTAAIVNPGAVEKVTRALARLGYLSDVEMSEEVHSISEEPDV
jgi:hypothetical protein